MQCNAIYPPPMVTRDMQLPPGINEDNEWRADPLSSRSLELFFEHWLAPELIGVTPPPPRPGLTHAMPTTGLSVPFHSSHLFAAPPLSGVWHRECRLDIQNSRAEPVDAGLVLPKNPAPVPPLMSGPESIGACGSPQTVGRRKVLARMRKVPDAELW
jgi:hypothetical protein